MSKTNRKEILFERFSNQLSILKENGLISVELKYDKTYICPICLGQFSKDDLKIKNGCNYLTEEDAPPASLGGKRVALTCKKCNSECGHKIDYQLKELIKHEENSKFIKGAIQSGTIDFEGKSITVELTSEGNGKLIAKHDENLNDPSIFIKFIKSVKRDVIMSFKTKKSKIDANKVNYAFLKTNYILTFGKFGYIFLLDKAYDSIREQILNPDKEIVKFNLAISNPHLKDHLGTHYIVDSGIKAIFNIFKLKTILTDKPYGAFLPIPKITIENFVMEMEKRIVDHVAVFNKTIYDDKIDLFADLKEIKKIKKWTEEES
jgi:hypothetical protein